MCLNPINFMDLLMLVVLICAAYELGCSCGGRAAQK